MKDDVEIKKLSKTLSQNKCIMKLGYVECLHERDVNTVLANG